ncbi:MAG: cobalamin-binding protein [Nitrospira sp.]|nr:cobalamin-binding protein [Nitrospira sp.]
MAPSITEMLFAIGAGDLVAGVTPFCDFPPGAARKPKVGYGSPNVESLVVLQPDLVLAPQEFVKPDLVATLDHLHIPIFFLAGRTVDGVLTQIQTLGRMVNREAEAASLVMELRQRITAVKQRVQGQPPVRVLYVLNSEPLITVGPGSFIDQLIGLAGGINVAAKSTMPYPRLSIETVLLEDPEVLLFPVGSNGSHAEIPDDQRRAWQRWTSLSAIKQERLYSILGDLLNRPGPRIVEGLERLADILHPLPSAPAESHSEPHASGGS